MSGENDPCSLKRLIRDLCRGRLLQKRFVEVFVGSIVCHVRGTASDS